MKPRTAQIIYWIVTVLFALMMLLDGITGALREEGGKEALAYLGYPEYLLTILGIAKILGAIAVLQTVFRTIKEWAYAGFAFVFIGGFASHGFVGSGIGFLFLPILMLAVMFVSYFLWRKIESEKL
ncbi:MAG: DoxX family protein [Actinomycetota bacterium]